jgi:hypothetical protein
MGLAAASATLAAGARLVHTKRQAERNALRVAVQNLGVTNEYPNLSMHEPGCSRTTCVRFATDEAEHYRANASAVSLAFCGRGRFRAGRSFM